MINCGIELLEAAFEAMVATMNATDDAGFLNGNFMTFMNLIGQYSELDTRYHVRRTLLPFCSMLNTIIEKYRGRGREFFRVLRRDLNKAKLRNVLEYARSLPNAKVREAAVNMLDYLQHFNVWR